jgi:signal transducing adaptor molecule
MFSKVNPFDESVVAATDENLTGENWELILTVTDKLSRASPER